MRLFVIAFIFLLLVVTKAFFIFYFFLFALFFLSVMFLDKKKNIIIVLGLNLSVHILVVVYFFYFHDNSLLQGLDEQYFLAKARLISANAYTEDITIGTGYFIYFLSTLISLFGDSQVVLQFLFSLLYVFYLFMVYKILVDIFNTMPVKTAYFILLLGFLPSFFNYSILFTREVVDLLFLSVFIYNAYYYFETNKIKFFVPVFLSLGIIFLIDHKFTVISPILLMAFFYTKMQYKKGLSKMVNMLFVFFFLVVSLLVLPYVKSGHLGGISDSGIAEYTEKRLASANTDARAIYGSQLNTSSLPALVASLPVATLYYLTTPFPWQVRSAGDLVGFFMVLLELYFYFLVIKLLLIKKHPLKKYIRFIVTISVIIFTINAIGTINWGTAFRHKTAHTWMFFLLGYYYLQHKKTRRKS